MKRVFACFLVLGTALVGCTVDAAYGKEVDAIVREEDLKNGEAFIQNLGNKAVKMIRSPGANAKQIIKDYNSLIDENLATEKVAIFIIRKRYFDGLSSEQKNDLYQYIKIKLSKLYSTQVVDYIGSNLNFVVIPNKKQKNTGIIVNSKIEIPGKKDILIKWKIRKIHGVFKVIDIVIGDSLSVFSMMQADCLGYISQNGLTRFCQKIKTEKDIGIN